MIRFLPFPLPGVDAMAAATDRAFPRHTHDQYGIGVVDDGGHSSWSGRGQVEAGPGTLISVNPGEVHDGRAVGRRPRSWRILYVEPAVMEAACGDARDGAAGAFAFAAPAFSDVDLRRRLDDAFACAGSRDALAAESAFLALVARLLRHGAGRPRPTAGPAPPVRRARERIDADPAAPVTLADLAREAGLSRYQLLRGFARETGLTPHAYVVQRRIELARRLLRAGHALAEAAVLAGFCDQSHLTRCFARRVGVTPGRYVVRAR